MISSDLHIVRSEEGDWIALYGDGELLVEGHSFRPEDVLKALGIPFSASEISLAEYESVFPQEIEDATILNTSHSDGKVLRGRI